MTLSTGTRLGPYEITAKLGEGGMGEVYRATDTKLDRQVAIKVLPAEFTEDRERLARFEREAKLLAQLHHPNIASIFGLEESDGTRALVMELVEGPTLAERLESGPLPFNESLSVSLQIAHALEEAHEKGIVHRDLKPQNIKASIEGKVKVLDFGLAKAMDPTAGSAASAADMARSPTLMRSPTLTAVHGTQLGVILGTAAYMAPEQAAGGVADRRADVWSFGVVLYEMLAGRRLFEGETVSHVLAGVLKDEPDFSKLPEGTPRALRELVRRCLRKKPRERLQSIGDARLTLEELLAGVTDEPASAALAAPPERRPLPVAKLAAGFVAAAALGSLATWVVAGRAAPALFPPTTLSELPLPSEAPFLAGPLELSPDGSKLALVLANEGGTRRIWVHTLASGDQRPIPGTESVRYVFWSPDGRSLGFRSAVHDQLERVDLVGGQPIPLAKGGGMCGATWGRDAIVFCRAVSEPLARVSPSGGAVEPVTTLGDGERIYRPRFLPDGERFVYRVTTRADTKGRLLLGSLDGGEPKALVESDSIGVVDGGFLFFLRGATLLARPFDLRSAALGAGEPRIVAEGVSPTFGGRFTVAAGLLAFAPPAGGAGTRIQVYDRTGKSIDQIDSDTFLDDLVLSPDGRRAAVMKAGVTGESGSNVSDVWTIDLARKVFDRATYGEADDDGLFSPDGKSLAFAHEGDLYVRPVQGAGEPKLLVASDGDAVTQEWTTDGWIVYSDVVNREEELFAVRADGSEPRRLTTTPFREGLARLSPDGRWLAYTSTESGNPEVYLTSWPEFSGKWRVSSLGAAMPQWGKQGRELYFLSADSKLLRVSVATADGAPEIGLVEELFSVAFAGNYAARTVRWAAAPDGERFYVLESIPGQADADTSIRLVTNPIGPTGGGR